MSPGKISSAPAAEIIFMTEHDDPPGIPLEQARVVSAGHAAE